MNTKAVIAIVVVVIAAVALIGHFGGFFGPKGPSPLAAVNFNTTINPGAGNTCTLTFAPPGGYNGKPYWVELNKTNSDTMTWYLPNAVGVPYHIQFTGGNSPFVSPNFTVNPGGSAPSGPITGNDGDYPYTIQECGGNPGALTMGVHISH